MEPSLPTLWHPLEVGTHDGTKYGLVPMLPECGCSPEAPCATLKAYYSHNLVPAMLGHGKYRMRLGPHGYMEVERTDEQGAPGAPGR